MIFPHASPTREPYFFRHSWCTPECFYHRNIFVEWEKVDLAKQEQERKEKISNFLQSLSPEEREKITHCSLCIQRALEKLSS